MKTELARIEGKQNIAKDVREMWEIKKPRILSALKKSQSRAVGNILAKLEDCEMLDEKGRVIIIYMNPLFTANYRASFNIYWRDQSPPPSLCVGHPLKDSPPW